MLLVTFHSLLFLSACGFHLRGGAAAVTDLPPLFLAGDEGAMRAELRHALSMSNAKPVAREQARWILTLADERIDRRVLSVGAGGAVEEYELEYTIRFAVNTPEGASIGAPQTVNLTRAYRFDTADVLGKDNEQEMLLDDMRRDAAQQILRRLRALITPPEKTPPP